MAEGGGFEVTVHGTIERAECLEAGMLYARSMLVKGKDWVIATAASGERATNIEVVTQMSERLPGPYAKFAWNAPFEFTLRSTNVSGWPQLAIALITIDGSGQDVAVGYARCHVPMRPGHTSMDLPLMQPIASTPQHALFSVLTGVRPELRDMSFICSSDDRVVMTAKRLPGSVRVAFDVLINGMSALGYEM